MPHDLVVTKLCTWAVYGVTCNACTKAAWVPAPARGATPPVTGRASGRRRACCGAPARRRAHPQRHADEVLAGEREQALGRARGWQPVLPAQVARGPLGHDIHSAAGRAERAVCALRQRPRVGLPVHGLRAQRGRQQEHRPRALRGRGAGRARRCRRAAPCKRFANARMLQPEAPVVGCRGQTKPITPYTIPACA